MPDDPNTAGQAAGQAMGEAAGPSLGEAMTGGPGRPDLFNAPHLKHHPGYVARYEAMTGKPYYVPVGSPKNDRDREALAMYDNDAYNMPMESFAENAPETAFDPDTGKGMPYGKLQSLLLARYPKQNLKDWNQGANEPQPVIPGQGARVAPHVGWPSLPTTPTTRKPAARPPIAGAGMVGQNG